MAPSLMVSLAASLAAFPVQAEGADGTCAAAPCQIRLTPQQLLELRSSGWCRRDGSPRRVRCSPRWGRHPVSPCRSAS
ncbi:hypothetical protein AB5I41_23420 [Sphingomonas sp. MMS24-JH45]